MELFSGGLINSFRFGTIFNCPSAAYSRLSQQLSAQTCPNQRTWCAKNAGSVRNEHPNVSAKYCNARSRKMNHGALRRLRPTLDTHLQVPSTRHNQSCVLRSPPGIANWDGAIVGRRKGREPSATSRKSNRSWKKIFPRTYPGQSHLSRLNWVTPIRRTSTLDSLLCVRLFPLSARNTPV